MICASRRKIKQSVDACKRYLDAHFAWQDDLSQDDLCSGYQMMNYCENPG